jgi:FtsH-binding integral membrane protein
MLSQRTAAFNPTHADDMVGRVMKPLDSIWRLILACVLVFAASFGLSLVAIWLLPAGEVIGNILRGIAAVISALLILAYASKQTSSSPGKRQK